MIEASPSTILGIFLIFCRIGGCLMLMPGFSSNRVPMNVRLFIALTTSLAVAPLVMGRLPNDLANQTPLMTFWLILSELLTGIMIGLLGRVYFMALQTLVTAVAMAIGFGSIPGAPMDDAEPLPAIGSMIMMVATAMLFLSDLHWELFRGLAASYARLPVGEGFGTRVSLVEIVDQIGAAFVLALRISSPFIVYSVVVNLAVGLTNKLTPQVPIFFIATPFVMLGGLLLFYFLVKDYMTLFMDAFANWVANG
ncbi:flagellar biosynthesis protein FliR [Microvirga roseola]|uniref:flagellar biosynthesis protein FliR n=1 Tax=Microvirga roseola TaxID=2883126 RepID=UPI001E5FC88E|nr:flagellar biosynthesis protein FliR [Microvirga roseola]